LVGRQTESEEAIQRRLEVAERELAQAHRYRHRVINETVPQAVREICEILQKYAP
jgi:guanylate kinase